MTAPATSPGACSAWRAPLRLRAGARLGRARARCRRAAARRRGLDRSGSGWLEAPVLGAGWPGARRCALVAVGICAGLERRARLSGGGVAGSAGGVAAPGAAGALTALLDRPALGTSDDAARAGRPGAGGRRRAARAATRPSRSRGRSAGSALGGLRCAGARPCRAFGSAGPARGPAAALWHPRARLGRHGRPGADPRRRETSSTGATRSTLELEAFGRRTATLWLRAPGEAGAPRGVPLDSLGRATVTTGALQSDLFARVTSGSRASDTVLIRVRLPVFLGSLIVTAHYPAYLGLEAEPVPTGGDTLLLPAGTRLETRGEATAPLASAAWAVGRSDRRAHGGRRALQRQLRSRRRRASIAWRSPPRAARRSPGTRCGCRSGSWPTARRGSMCRCPAPIRWRRSASQVPLVVDVRDDHGITSVVLESRRISRLGRVPIRRGGRRVALPHGDARPRHPHATRSTSTAAACCPATPSAIVAVAADNTPRRSDRPLARVRASAADDERGARRAAAGHRGRGSSRLDSVAAASKQLERQTDDLAQERPRPSDGRREKNGRVALVRGGQEGGGRRAIAAGADPAGRGAEAVARGAARRAPRQPGSATRPGSASWRRSASSSSGRSRPSCATGSQELQQALKDLDAERTKDALERLAEAQKELREALERSRELFRRAALEGDLANLSKESKDLAQEQRKWNQQVAPPTAPGRRRRSASSRRARIRSARRSTGSAKSDGRLGAAGPARCGGRPGPAGRASRCSRPRRSSQQGQRQEARAAGRAGGAVARAAGRRSCSRSARACSRSGARRW